MTSLTRKEFYKKFEKAKINAYKTYYRNCPVDTGYLRSMIQLIELKNGFLFLNDVWYMKFTEEKWQRKSNIKNPNEGWFRKTTEEVFKMIVKEMMR